jgi:hypothetical protein
MRTRQDFDIAIRLQQRYILARFAVRNSDADL